MASQWESDFSRLAIVLHKCNIVEVGACMQSYIVTIVVHKSVITGNPFRYVCHKSATLYEKQCMKIIKTEKYCKHDGVYVNTVRRIRYIRLVTRLQEMRSVRSFSPQF